jgi:hypothetical protein
MSSYESRKKVLVMTRSRLIAGPAKTLATVISVVMGPLTLAMGLAPHAYAGADSYLNCTNGIPGDTDAKLALGREAYNATGGNRSRAAYEGLALAQKYNLSESVASRIAGCAVYYGPF